MRKNYLGSVTQPPNHTLATPFQTSAKSKMEEQPQKSTNSKGGDVKFGWRLGEVVRRRGEGSPHVWSKQVLIPCATWRVFSQFCEKLSRFSTTPTISSQKRKFFLLLERLRLITKKSVGRRWSESGTVKCRKKLRFFSKKCTILCGWDALATSIQKSATNL